jgi:hypothetical protein
VLENGEKIAGTTGHLARVATSYDPDTRALGLDGAHALPAGFGQAWKIRADAADLGSGYVFVRVWDRGDDHTSPLAIPIAPAPVKLGSTGIQVSIAGTARVAGDHWIIAARPETPNQVVPWSLEDGRGVHGVRRWFAPLALIQWKLGNPDIPLPGPVEGKRVGLELLHDCRPVFAPLTELFGDCAVVVKPGPLWWSRIQRYVAAAEHVHLCFAPGVYPIDKPLVIADKASVKITGAGPGTLLTASGETALQLLRCKSVIVRDLAASAAKVLSGPVQGRPRINGALTITDCARVEVTGVTASCGSGLVRSAACVAINHLLNQEVIPHPAVRVSGCDFRPGDGQIGLIVLNPSRATIADNTVAVNPDAVAPSIGTVLSALPLRASLEVSLLSGIQFRDPDSPDSPDASVDGPTHLVDPSQPIGDGAIKMPITGRVVAWFYSDVSAKVWKLAIGIRPFPSNQEPTHRDVRRYLRKMARDIVLGHGRLDGHNISEAINWFALATESLRPAAAQGIVVAGMGAEDVRVTGNTVRDATQGIHVGVSHVSTDPEHPYDRISRVFVDRNQIDLVIRADRVRERHGVFVGNADNATIGDNQVFVARVGLGVVQYLEGVRLYGLLGPKAVIRDNYLSWFRVGVRFMISEAYYQSSPMWRVANNYCPYSTMAVVVNSKKIKLNGNHS